MERNESLPRWLRELDRYLPVKTLLLLYGNTYDKLLYQVADGEDTRWAYLNLRELLYRFFLDRKYRLIGFYDVVDGLTFLSDQECQRFKAVSRGQGFAGPGPQPGRAQAAEHRQGGGYYGGNSPHPEPVQHPPARGGYLQDFDAALDAIRKVMANRDVPAAIVIDFASRLVSAPGHLLQKERLQFVKLLKCTTEASRVNIDGEAYNNVIILICDKLNDLPAWLYLNNPLAKPIQIDRPSDEERRRYFEMTAGAFYGYEPGNQDPEKTIQSFVDLTHGMGNYELESLRLISFKEKIPFNKPKNVIESYKFGVKENKWEQLRKNKFIDAEKVLKKRVKGQDAAVRTVVEIIKRAAVGMSGIQHSSSAHKPRGILFFAGPTGVGKTELAKALAELLFGDENACIRFDMSEYALEHADQKLLGAPPGYVGYEEGGQLTNKVKESPFSVLLFDEIEKAHPKILDKFLQILEDGRMTDGKGETVYFSESIIIFTSNIGAYTDTPAGDGVVIRKPNVLPYSWRCRECGQSFIEEDMPASCDCGAADFEKMQTPYSQVKERILKAVEEHFKFKLGRPEIYNRIGNNFVVFDYIRPEVADLIIDKILDGITGKMAEQKNLRLEFARPVRDFLRERAFNNVELGGRGIGNLIETTLVNPLAGEIFDRGIDGGKLVIKSIVEREEGSVVTYSLEIEG
ncbi:MAG: AAA family ATPase [Bacillota bacterium]|nr:AAA family ATPase [Bacillota bacterium]